MLLSFTDLILDNIISFLNIREIYFLRMVNSYFNNFNILDWQDYPYRSRLDSLHYLYNLAQDKVWEDSKLIDSLGLGEPFLIQSGSSGLVNIFRDKYDALINKRVYNPQTFHFRGQLPNLQYLTIMNITLLEISYTDKDYLPLEIEKLTKLNTLIVNNNKFSYIPDPIFNLSNLIDLDIHSNPITKISDKLLNLDKLEKLDISNTLIRNIENIPTENINSVIVNGLNILHIKDEYIEMDILKTY